VGRIVGRDAELGVGGPFLHSITLALVAVVAVLGPAVTSVLGPTPAAADAPFGFEFGGSNFDSDSRLQGILTVGDSSALPAEAPPPGDTSVEATQRQGRAKEIRAAR
jgi:hypothetical protein